MESNLLRGRARRAGNQSVCCRVLAGPERWAPLHETGNNNKPMSTTKRDHRFTK